jgi:hypothetical protein
MHPPGLKKPATTAGLADFFFVYLGNILSTPKNGVVICDCEDEVAKTQRVVLSALSKHRLA